MIRSNCTKLYAEVVSTLCFGQSGAPEDELVKMLLDTVFPEPEEGTEVNPGTRNFTPFALKPVIPSDEKPILHSFLLQLLLEHKYVATDRMQNYSRINCVWSGL